MAQALSAGGGGGGQFGDTTLTKVFVGGLAWETQKEGMRSYFEQFGEILEAVVITDKNTGRSKGYGFVTFGEPEAAMKACFDPYPVIDGRRANCNLAYLGVQRSKAAPASLYPYVAHVHGGGNMRAMKPFQTAAVSAGGASLSFPDHGSQQGFPATYNVYGYSPYFSDYGYPLTYYQAYGGVGAQYQVFNGGAAAAAGLTMANPTGLYPYFQYGPTSAAAGYSMQYPAQIYQYAAAAAAVGAPTTTASLTAAAGLQQYASTVALAPNSSGQQAGVTIPLTAPTLHAPTPQYQYRLVSSHLAAAPEKPLT